MARLGRTLTRIPLLVLVAAAVLEPGAPRAEPARARAPAQLSIAIAGTPMHGIEGITVGPDGALYVASIAGQSLYRVDPGNGAISTFVAPPDGAADDLTFAADGSAVWTGGDGMTTLMSRSPGGRERALVRATPGLNAVRFSSAGRLYFTRIFAGDGLYEADPLGVAPVRTIAENIGGLNAFDFAPDGAIVGPLFMRGTVVRIDPASGASQELATGFSYPSAVRVLPDGYLVLNYRSGEIWRLDASAAHRRLLARVEPPADNFILKGTRTLYVTSTAYNGITEIDLDTAAQRRVTWSGLTLPGMLTTTGQGTQERLLIADDTTLKRFDPRTGALDVLPIGPAAMGIRAAVPQGTTLAISSAYQPDRISLVDAQDGRPLSVIGGFGRPMGMVTVAGELWVADYLRGEVVRADAGRRVIASGLRGPVGIAISAGGSAFVSEYQAGRIVELSPGTTPDGGYRATTLVLGGLRHPEGLAMARDGRLLVVDTGTRQLIAVDVRSGRRTILAEHLAVGYRHTAAESDPVAMAGIAVTGDGTVYVSGSAANVLYRISFPQSKGSHR